MNGIGISLAIISLASFLEERFYLTDLLASFRFQYVWIFLILCSIKLIQKKNFNSGICFLLAFVNLILIYPSWTNIESPSSSDLKIYYANILSSNDGYNQLIESISKHNPDIIVLLELNSRWKDTLMGLEKMYPHQIQLPREDNFGMGIFSKFEFLNKEFLKGKADVESILFQIKDLTILATHPVPPVSPEYWKLRNNQYKEIEEYINRIEGSKVLIGDLNTVPWSSFLSRLSKDTNLKMVNTFEDTWNSAFPVGMRIRLDHVFISKNLRGSLEILEDVGSDHLPMLLKLKYKK